MVLHDSHAEVLARRGLLRVFWQEIEVGLKHQQKLTVMGKNYDSDVEVNSWDDSKSLLEVQKNKVSGNSSMIGRNINANGEGDRIPFYFRLKPHIDLHLYVSDSPCGDASIYGILPQYRKEDGITDNVKMKHEEEHQKRNLSCNNTFLNFTGAKIVISTKDVTLHAIDNPEEKGGKTENLLVCDPSNTSSFGRVAIARERCQVKAVLRLKSSRSNTPEHLRSTSMSCSDKICRWVVLGLQGSGILRLFLPDAIGLRSVVVSRDPRVCGRDNRGKVSNDGQRKALERAIITRSKEVWEGVKRVDKDNQYGKSPVFPFVFVVDEVFSQGKTVVEKEIADQNFNFLGQNNGDCVGDRTKDMEVSQRKRKLNEIKTSMVKDFHKIKTHQHKRKKLSPCGISMNWQQQSFLPKSNEIKSGLKNNKCQIEQTVGAKGIKQGKMAKSLKNVIDGSSRLCRWALLNQNFKSLLLLEKYQTSDFLFVSKTLKDLQNGAISYQKAKSIFAPDATGLSNLIFSEMEGTPLFGWVRSSEECDFFHHYLI